jgi:hypothetical protein
MIAAPIPRRGRKEKYEIHLEIPFEFEPEPPGADDITCDYFPPTKGGTMVVSVSDFGPPRAPGKRYKALFFGKAGSGKSLSALSFPKCAYLDNHGSVEPYQAAYPDHRFAPPPGTVATVDYTMELIDKLSKSPGDRLTVVIDDITTYHDALGAKWNALLLKRNLNSKGHKSEFYVEQPSDYGLRKREFKAFITMLLGMDVNVIVIARETNEYAGASGGSDFMRVIGQTYAGDKNLIYDFDFAFQFVQEGGVRFAKIFGKQRVPAGGRPFPERLPFEITEKGYSTFFQAFSQYAVVQNFETPCAAVIPRVESFPREEGPGFTQDQQISAAAEKALAGTPPGTTILAQPIPITLEQLDKLVELKAHYKIENEEWGKTLQKFYGVTTAKALTEEQAKAYIKYLSEQRAPF